MAFSPIAGGGEDRFMRVRAARNNPARIVGVGSLVRSLCQRAVSYIGAQVPALMDRS